MIWLGTFSKLVEDEKLLEEVGDASSVAIIGCINCANMSIAYAKDISPIGKSSLFGIRYTPYAVIRQANHIKDLLESKGKSAVVKIFSRTSSPPCGMLEKERGMIAETCRDMDAAVTLCCDSGWEGIKSALAESFKTILGMKAVGIFNAYLNTDGGNVFLDRKKTKIMYFKELAERV